MGIKREEPLVKLDYNQPKFNLEEKETLVDSNPTYMRKQMKKDDEIIDTPEPITIDSSDEMLMFSDDLEVPAFIRNRNL